jgi:hypothetical protein
MRHLSKTLCLSPYPYRYLHLYRYQMLIGKEQCPQGVGRQLGNGEIKFEMPLRPRRNGRNPKDCADAQVAGGRLRPIPRRLILRSDGRVAC